VVGRERRLGAWERRRGNREREWEPWARGVESWEWELAAGEP
jgi:hypothetical protein